MIPYERFLECHLDYYQKFRKAKENVLKSTESLISHPEVSERYKTKLLKFRRELLTGLGS